MKSSVRRTNVLIERSGFLAAARRGILQKPPAGLICHPRAAVAVASRRNARRRWVISDVLHGRSWSLRPVPGTAPAAMSRASRADL